MPTLTITSDKPVVVIPIDEYEDLVDKAEIYSDKSLLESIQQGRKEFAEGKTKSLEQVLKELGED